MRKISRRVDRWKREQDRSFAHVLDFFDNVGNKISASIRKDLFVHIQKLSADFFDKNNTGELMARIKDDVDHIWDALGFVGMLLIEVTYHTIIIIVCMARINVLLIL